MEDVAQVHRDAVAAGDHHYRDPATGYRVITVLGHRARGTCCGNGCRHCPWDHCEVAPEHRAGLHPPIVD